MLLHAFILVSRAVLEALLAAVEQLQSWSSKQLQSHTIQNSSQVAAVTGTCSLAGLTAKESGFAASPGADGVGLCHGSSAMDLKGLTAVVAEVLKALHSMQRWFCILRLGGCKVCACCAVQ